MPKKKEINNSRMILWDAVSKTDPAITKKVNQRGGFTAICAQAQLKEATKQWGPYGHHWGLKDCNFGTITNAEGTVLEIYLDATFYYPVDANGQGIAVVQFPISTDCTYRAGNDSRKKLMTDATTKALSKLGFNSDVFEGKFDDNKYIATMKQEFSQTDEMLQEELQNSKSEPKDKLQSKAILEGYENASKTCANKQQAVDLIEGAREDYPKLLSYEQKKLKELIDYIKGDWGVGEDDLGI